jgi:SAM-dependent methyltransferase
MAAIMINDDLNSAAKKWNNKYLTDERFQNVPVRRLVRENVNLLPKSGWALEIAGGMGATTDFLEQNGLNVIDIDISFTALCRAMRLNSNPYYILADACHLPLKPMQFDVICNFYFLERSVFDSIKKILRPGGLLFFESMFIDMLSVRPDIHPEKLLRHNELADVFCDWEVLFFFEGWTDSDHGKRKAISQLIARKPYTSV